MGTLGTVSPFPFASTGCSSRGALYTEGAVNPRAKPEQDRSCILRFEVEISKGEMIRFCRRDRVLCACIVVTADQSPIRGWEESLA